MADHDFNIRINTKLDAEGAQAAKVVLEQQIAYCKQMGVSFEEEEKALKSLNDSLAKHSDAAHDATKETEKLELSHHELHKIGHTIGTETIPGIGAALGELATGPVGAVLAVVEVFRVLQEVIAKVEERAIRFASIKWEAHVASIEEATEAAHNLAEALDKAAKPADAIKTSFTESLAVLNAHIEARKTILKQMEAEALAAAGGDHEKENAIKDQFARAESTYDAQAEKQRRLEKQKERLTYESAATVAKGQSELVGKQVSDAENDPEFIANKAKVANLDAEKKPAIEKARAVVDSYGGTTAVQLMRDEGKGDPSPEGAVKALEYEEAQKALKLINEYDSAAAAVREQTETIKRLKQVQEDLAAKAEADTRAATDIKTDQTTEHKTDQQKDAGADFSKALSLETRVLGGGQLDKNEEMFMRTLGSVIAGHNVTLQTAEAMFQTALKNNQALDSMLSRLGDVMEHMTDTVLKNFNDRLNVIIRKMETQTHRDSTGGIFLTNG